MKKESFSPDGIQKIADFYAERYLQLTAKGYAATILQKPGRAIDPDALEDLLTLMGMPTRSLRNAILNDVAKMRSLAKKLRRKL